MDERRNDVLNAIDQLRRDLSGYYGQIKAHNDLQRHCDNQRKRIGELEGLYAKAKAENAKLRQELKIRQESEQEKVIEYLRQENADWEVRYRALIKEYVRLRNLVREAHSCKTNEGCCEDCYCDEGCCPIERRMQELGIDVPDA